MGRMMRKGDLPSRTCVRCGRPFAWRRKWADCWSEVRYCSRRCRAARSTEEDQRVLEA
ncbi:MAG: DUF2256 domain-containing protein [Gammaproteobacteria bacterium]